MILLLKKVRLQVEEKFTHMAIYFCVIMIVLIYILHYRRKQAQHNAPPKKRIHQATHSSVLAGWPASSVLVLMNGSGHLAASIGESGGCL